MANPRRRRIRAISRRAILLAGDNKEAQSAARAIHHGCDTVAAAELAEAKVIKMLAPKAAPAPKKEASKAAPAPKKGAPKAAPAPKKEAQKIVFKKK